MSMRENSACNIKNYIRALLFVNTFFSYRTKKFVLLPKYELTQGFARCCEGEFLGDFLPTFLVWFLLRNICVSVVRMC